MSRKHSKKFAQKVPVQKIVVKPAVVSREREAREVPEGTDGAIPITQEDGSTKYFVVSFKVTVPEVVKYVATGPTQKHGAKNDPKTMAPKGKSGSAPLMRKQGK